MAPALIYPRLWPVPPRPLSCRLITDIAAAEGLRPAWDELLQRTERNELTQSPHWLLTWWQVFGNSQGRQLRLAAFFDQDRLVGLAPLLRRRHWYDGLLPFRRLEFLASGEPAKDGIYSNHLGVLAESGFEEEVIKRLIDAIVTGALGSWDEIVLPMMDEDSGQPQRLAEAFRSAGHEVESKVTAAAPYIPLPATWDEYLQALPGKQ